MSVKIEILSLYERKKKMANRVRAKIKTLRVSPTDETKLKRRVAVKKLMLLDVTLTKLLDTFMKQEQLNPRPSRCYVKK